MTPSAPTVVRSGAATLDTLFRVPALPTGHGKLLPTAIPEVAHGMATSAATAIARLGGRAVLLARVGADPNGDRLVAEIAAAGVDGRRVEGVRSPLATVLIDPAGERLVVPYHDPALGRDADWLPSRRSPGPTPSWSTCAGRKAPPSSSTPPASPGSPPFSTPMSARPRPCSRSPSAPATPSSPSPGAPDIEAALRDLAARLAARLGAPTRAEVEAVLAAAS